MNGENFFNGFGFDKNAVLDKEVETQRFFTSEAFVGKGDELLVGGTKLAEFQFAQETPFVDRFDQAWTLVFVNLDSCTDDGFGKGGGFGE